MCTFNAVVPVFFFMAVAVIISTSSPVSKSNALSQSQSLGVGQAIAADFFNLNVARPIPGHLSEEQMKEMGNKFDDDKFDEGMNKLDDKLDKGMDKFDDFDSKFDNFDEKFDEKKFDEAFKDMSLEGKGKLKDLMKKHIDNKARTPEDVKQYDVDVFILGMEEGLLGMELDSEMNKKAEELITKVRKIMESVPVELIELEQKWSQMSDAQLKEITPEEKKKAQELMKQWFENLKKDFPDEMKEVSVDVEEISDNMSPKEMKAWRSNIGQQINATGMKKFTKGEKSKESEPKEEDAEKNSSSLIFNVFMLMFSVFAILSKF